MRVNEGKQSFVTARAVDRNGVVIIPTTARFRLDDYKTKQAIIAWTVIELPDLNQDPTADPTLMLITIPATSNTIINNNNAREKKVVTVETDFGTATANTEDFEYWVRNLRFIG